RGASPPPGVAPFYPLGQELAAGRVDALADDRERPIEADDHLARCGGDDRVRDAGAAHSRSPSPPDAIRVCSFSFVYTDSSRPISASASASMSAPQSRSVRRISSI